MKLKTFQQVLFIALFLTGISYSGIAEDWPSFSGPKNSFSGDNPEVELLPNLSKGKRLWVSEETNLGFGKGSGGAGADITSGGHATPIIYDSLVLVSYYRPSGTDMAESLDGYGNSDKYDANFLIHATDYMVAVSMKTGKTVWKNSYSGGMHINMPKRGGWAVTPVAYDGKVFHLTTLGKLYAYDVTNGQSVWSSPTNINNAYMEGILNDHLNNKTVETGKIEWNFGLVEAGGVIIVGNYSNGLYGIDPDNGDQLWSLSSIRSGAATPTVITLGGKEYVFTGYGSKITLIDPQDGSTLWSTQSVSGEPLDDNNNDFTITNSGNVVLLAVQSDVYSEHGRIAGVRITKNQPELLWKLEEDHTHPQSGDFDKIPWAAAAHGNFYASLRGKQEDLLIIDAESGTIIDRQAGGGGNDIILYNEGYLFVEGDATHSGPTGFSVFDVSNNSLINIGGYSTDFAANHGYDLPMLIPNANGKMVFRTGVVYDSEKGYGGDLRCFDFRFYPQVLGSLQYTEGAHRIMKESQQIDIDFTAIDRNGVRILADSLDNVNWEVTGGGTITNDGTFTAGDEAGTYFAITHVTLDSITVTDSVEIVIKYKQSINCPELNKVYYGIDSFDLQCTATSGLPVEYTYVSGNFSLSGSTVKPYPVESTARIDVKQPGNQTYAAASPVRYEFEFTSNPEDTLTIGTSQVEEGSQIPSVHPNPTSGMIKITGGFEQKGPVAVHVYNMLGDVVAETVLESGRNKTAENVIDISAEPAGVYLVKIGNHIEKVIKQ